MAFGPHPTAALPNGRPAVVKRQIGYRAPERGCAASDILLGARMAEISIEVAGRAFRLACPDGDEPRARELAEYVKEKVEALAKAHGQVGADRLLLMAAMMTADELFELREGKSEQQDADG
jgi:cell division protein ZapA